MAGGRLVSLAAAVILLAALFSAGCASSGQSPQQGAPQNKVVSCPDGTVAANLSDCPAPKMAKRDTPESADIRARSEDVFSGMKQLASNENATAKDLDSFVASANGSLASIGTDIAGLEKKGYDTKAEKYLYGFFAITVDYEQKSAGWAGELESMAPNDTQASALKYSEMEGEMNSTIAAMEQANGTAPAVKTEAGDLYDFYPNTDYMISTVSQLRDEIAKLG